jgi:hypothetical protein
MGLLGEVFAESVSGNKSINPILILQEALDQVDKANTVHTVKEISEKDTKRTIDKYIMHTPDGRNLERTEILTNRKGKDPTKTVTIFNEEGIWYLTNNKALLLKDEMERLDDINKIDSNNLLKKIPTSNGNKYEIQDIFYQDNPCYKILVELSAEEFTTRVKLKEAINEQVYKIRFQKLAPKKKFDGKATNSTPKIYEYIIGKETKFIYSENKYAPNGDRISGNAYSRIEINIPLYRGLFMVPQGMKKFIINTDDDFIQATARK